MIFTKVVALKNPRIVLFTGGTAANSFTGALLKKNKTFSNILPVSDNGGSSAEIQNFIDGPAIGDIRSRIVRLAPETLMRKVLQYRLPSSLSGKKAYMEWNDILSMRHNIWKDMPKKYRDIIRAGLNMFNATLKTKIDIEKQFNFNNASIGNFFFSGERIHFGSLSATIEIFKYVLGIGRDINVIPVMDVNERVNLGVLLANMAEIKGQSDISHPSKKGNTVDKTITTPLPSKVDKIRYLDRDNKVPDKLPNLCEDVLPSIENAGTIVYSMGSFYTSLLPSLILKGVGETIKLNQGKKIIIINGSYDRETTYLDNDGNVKKMSVSEFLQQLQSALNRYGKLNNELSDYLTDIIILESGEIQPEETESFDGIKIHMVESEEMNSFHYNSEKLVEKLVEHL